MGTVVAMVRHRSPKLFSDFNNLQFVAVFGSVLFVVLLFLMTDSPHYHSRSYSVDLPKTLHPVSMPWANRDDAMIVTVTRDGQIYFGVNRIVPAELPERITERLKDQSVERKVYIKADMRARWGAVKLACDAAHQAGILRVGVLVDKKRVSAF
jgi:biopolymer transport protein ExbD/biopolymer transport protein TolR